MDIDMLLMVEEGIRGGICHAIHRYAKANNEYMNNYDKSIISAFLKYLHANNFYGWPMTQKLSINGFKWVEIFHKRFIKSYNENSDIGYFLEVDVEYPKKLFYLKEKNSKKAKKLVCGIEDKGKYVVHIRAVKQALNHELILKKVHRVIQFNQKAWLKPYVNMNTKLRKEAKNEFEKDFFKLMNNAVYGKTMENVTKHRYIKLVTTEEKRNKLVSEQNYYTTKHFSKNLLAIEMKKTKACISWHVNIRYQQNTYV